MPRIIEVVQGEDPGTEDEDVRRAAKELVAAYADPERGVGSGFRIEDVAGGLQLRSTAENAAYLRRLLATRPQRLTKPALEVLAIIAYRQPVTRPDVEKLRGVDSGTVIKALLDRDLIRILGKSDEVGRPILYGTSKQFLELFSLKSLAALPTLREYHELDTEHQAQVDALYEDEKKPLLSDLAATAEFLVDRKHDPDLDALDLAVQRAEQVERTAKAALDPSGEASGEAEAGEAPTTPSSGEEAQPEGSP